MKKIILLIIILFSFDNTYASSENDYIHDKENLNNYITSQKKYIRKNIENGDEIISKVEKIMRILGSDEQKLKILTNRILELELMKIDLDNPLLGRLTTHEYTIITVLRYILYKIELKFLDIGYKPKNCFYIKDCVKATLLNIK